MSLLDEVYMSRVQQRVADKQQYGVSTLRTLEMAVSSLRMLRQSWKNLFMQSLVTETTKNKDRYYKGTLHYDIIARKTRGCVSADNTFQINWLFHLLLLWKLQTRSGSGGTPSV